MSTFSIRILVFFLISNSVLLFGQRSLDLLSEPEIAVNTSVNGRYALNFSLSTRQFIVQNEKFNLRNRQLDFSHFSTYVLNGANQLSLGFKYRNRDWFEESSNEIRITEQYNFLHASSSLRFGHRFRVEQRFFDDFVVHRFRYRLALDLPLNGFKLDIGEAFFASSLESLYSISKSNKPFLQLRPTTTVGWKLTDRLKYDIGLQYRTGNLVGIYEDSLFLLTSLNISI